MQVIECDVDSNNGIKVLVTINDAFIYTELMIQSESIYNDKEFFPKTLRDINLLILKAFLYWLQNNQYLILNGNIEDIMRISRIISGCQYKKISQNLLLRLIQLINSFIQKVNYLVTSECEKGIYQSIVDCYKIKFLLLDYINKTFSIS